ncbi:MAG: hypothetical protein RL065_1688 [Bacteroidota bacterium]
MTKNNYLFVYGTLRKDFDLPLSKQISDEIEFIETAKINGELYDIGEYPAALPQGNSKILGEVYLVHHPRKILKLLDEYEGYDRKKITASEYYRRKETIELNDGKKIEAWVYWYNFSVSNKRKIRQQDYLKYIKNK